MYIVQAKSEKNYVKYISSISSMSDTHVCTCVCDMKVDNSAF